MHVWFGDILDDDGNIEVPCSDGLVIRSSDKPPVFVYERYSVHRSKVLIVFLRDIAGVDVILLGVNC